MKGGIATCVVAVLLASCSVHGSTPTSTHPPESSTWSTSAASAPDDAVAASPPIRLLFAGDVMLGRRIGDVVESDPEGLFEDVRFVVSGADIAVANLESPLTVRSQVRSGEHLIADPDSARLLEAAGFDAMGLANNHAGDPGAGSIEDTIAALEAVSIEPVGSGLTAEDAYAPRVIEHAGVRVAYLAFDATGQGLPAGDTPGIASWSVATAQAAVATAREQADVVVVGLHGGIEYSTAVDPQLQRLGELLASWNVDVVWGHGPHVTQPVEVVDPDGDGQVTVVATSLGNFVFDQVRESTTQGAVLEVLANHGGVVAWRVGTTQHDDLRVHFEGWSLPDGDAALVRGEWWRLPHVPEIVEEQVRPELQHFPYGTVVDAGQADVTGDGTEEVVVAYRHPFRATPISELFAGHDLVDADGNSAHIGVFEVGSLRPLWGAGTLLEPIEEVVPCDTGVAVAYSSLDDRTIIATGALMWDYFGFVAAPKLQGAAELGCSDIDQDGRTDPLILDRP